MTYDLPLERRPPLSDLTVQHVGQHMAVVVADTLENAADAASLFDLDYEVRTAQMSALRVLAQPPARRRAGRADPSRSLPTGPLRETRRREAAGPARRAADEPATRSTASTAHFTTPVNAHYPIELSATIAAWDGDVLTVHDTTRWITGERTSAGRLPRTCPRTDIRILSPLVGGAFGSKSFLWMHVGALRGRSPRTAAAGQAGSHPQSDVHLDRAPAAHRAAPDARRRRRRQIAEHRAPHADRDFHRRALL